MGIVARRQNEDAHLTQGPIFRLFKPKFTNFSKRNKSNIVEIQVVLGCVEDGTFAEMVNFWLCASYLTASFALKRLFELADKDKPDLTSMIRTDNRRLYPISIY